MTEAIAAFWSVLPTVRHGAGAAKAMINTCIVEKQAKQRHQTTTPVPLLRSSDPFQKHATPRHANSLPSAKKQNLMLQ